MDLLQSPPLVTLSVVGLLPSSLPLRCPRAISALVSCRADALLDHSVVLVLSQHLSMVRLTPSFLSLSCPSIISARDCGRADALSSNSQFYSCYLSTTVICFITQLTSCYLRTCSVPVYDPDTPVRLTTVDLALSQHWSVSGLALSSISLTSPHAISTLVSIAVVGRSRLYH